MYLLTDGVSKTAEIDEGTWECVKASDSDALMPFHCRKNTPQQYLRPIRASRRTFANGTTLTPENINGLVRPKKARPNHLFCTR